MPPLLETARLLLEPLTPEQARAAVAGRSPGRPAAAGWPVPESLGALRLFAEHGAAGDDGGWLVVLRSTGEVIGDCSWRGGPDPTGTAEIGYGIAEPYRGQGYGHEAVAALTAWCLDRPGTRRLAAEVHVDNVASRRLVERLGFRLESASGGAAYYVKEG